MKLSDLGIKLKQAWAWIWRLSWKKKLMFLVALIIVAWLIVPRLFAASKIPQYQTATVERGSIIATLSESGNVTAAGQVNVASPTDGVIQETYVKNGDTVAIGDKLFSVKSTATPQEKSSALASYLSAQNSLNSAKAKMNSLQSALFKANQIFVNDAGTANPDTADPKYIEEKADWQQAESDYENQTGVINQARAAFDSASLAYQATQDSIVTAPADGTIANFSATAGTMVKASTTTSSGSNSSSSSSNSSNSSSSSSSPVLIIGDFSNLSLTAQVSEVDITSVKAGQKATITLDAFPDKTFVGTIDSVDRVGTDSSGVVTYNAYITFVSPPADIQPGMSATITIQTNRRDDVLKVPTTAVQTVGGQSVVRVLKNGQVNPVPVETGIASDSETEITSGLSEGDTVVTSIITPSSTTSQFGSSPFGGNAKFGGGGGFGGTQVFIRGGGGGGGRGGGGRGGGGKGG